MKIVVNGSYRGCYILDTSNINTIKYKVLALSGTGNFYIYSLSDEFGENWLTATKNMGDIPSSDKAEITRSGDTSEYKEVDVSQTNYIYLICDNSVGKIVELLVE